jgi:hypothetical protein
MHQHWKSSSDTANMWRRCAIDDSGGFMLIDKMQLEQNVSIVMS